MENKKSVELKTFKNTIKKGIILFLSILLLSNASSALDTGWVAPSANTGGSGVSNPQNAYADDTSYARFSSGGSSYWNYYGYDLSSIPGGSTIDGIEVNALGIRSSGSGNNRYMRVRLSWNSGTGWTSYSTDTTEWDRNNVLSHILGGATDTWGRSWTRDEIVTNFRIQAQWMANSNTGDLDYLPVKVYYTAPPSDTSRPSVTVEQATGQADPTRNSPINFEVVFNESVSDFDSSDVTLGGTALPATASVTGSGTTYNVAVSGMVNDGTVIVSIAENAAHDGAGNGNTASTSIDNTVTYDTTAPSITAPANVNAEATGTLTSVSIGTATATDLIDATPTITNDAPASYPVGFTTVHWTATDDAGNSATTTQSVTIQDTTAPTIDSVTPIVAEATGPSGATVTITAPISHDAVDGDLVSSCDFSTGTFPFGVTTVTCSKTDTQGNAATPSVFTVTVQDTIAPTIDAVTSIVAEATGPSGATVTITAPMSHDAVDGDLISSCDQATGTFPFGVTTVNCTKTDAHGNVATPSVFTVTVQDTTPPTIDAVTSIVAEATSSSGASVTITPPMSHDAVDGDIVSSCDLSTGTFPIGVTTVTCTKTDAHGNVATSFFTVTVQDTTAPTIDAVTSIVAEATGLSGATITINAPMSHDAVDGDIVSSCDLSTGTFPIGVTTVTCTKTDTHGNAATPFVFTVTVQDTIAPTIDTVSPILAEATGPSGATITINAPMSHDAVDGDLISSCDNSTGIFPLGVTTVTCTKTDTHGNAATPLIFTVTIQDTTAPVITLIGSTSVSIEAGLVYTDPGATALDIFDGDLTLSIVTGGLPVDTNIPGTYTITYDVTDSNGNAAIQVNRTVNVIDTNTPIITLSGDNPVTVEVGSLYTDAGATAQDNIDGNITSSIVTGGLPINTNVVGTYTVTYDVTDSNGNAAIRVTRTVNVVDTTLPVITLSGSNSVNVEAGSAYIDVGATAQDNYDGDITSYIVVGGLPINTNVLGAHTVTYDVNDSNGNAAIRVTRTVNVVDTTPPVITLSGSNPVTVEVGFFTYTDAGATALDNYDGVLTSSIVTGGLPVNTNILGPHTVTYDVTDSNGNAGIRVTRTVIVQQVSSSVRYINGTVIDSDPAHTPLAGVTVSTTGGISSVTDVSGKYSLQVGSGSYPLTASHDIRYYTNSSVTVSTTGFTSVTQDIELELKPVGTISGSVTQI